MTRTFSTLAALLIFAMVTTIGFGLWSFFLPRDDDFRQDIFLIHFHLGLWTSIGILLVHCIIFTYFLGTGRWVKEVSIAYQLPDDPLYKSTRELKRADLSTGAVLDADCNFYLGRRRGNALSILALVCPRRRRRVDVAHQPLGIPH